MSSEIGKISEVVSSGNITFLYYA